MKVLGVTHLGRPQLLTMAIALVQRFDDPAIWLSDARLQCSQEKIVLYRCHRLAKNAQDPEGRTVVGIGSSLPCKKKKKLAFLRTDIALYVRHGRWLSARSGRWWWWWTWRCEFVLGYTSSRKDAGLKEIKVLAACWKLIIKGPLRGRPIYYELRYIDDLGTADTSNGLSTGRLVWCPSLSQRSRWDGCDNLDYGKASRTSGVSFALIPTIFGVGRGQTVHRMKSIRMLVAQYTLSHRRPFLGYLSNWIEDI